MVNLSTHQGVWFQPSQGCFCGRFVTSLWMATPRHTHVLSFPRGGFPSIRHNEIRDVTGNLLTEVCHDVMVEPELQPLTGETLACATSNPSDGARLDIAVNGFWGGRYEKFFLDIRVFNSHAPSNNKTSINSCYRKHENEKKRAYENASVRLNIPPSLHLSSQRLGVWPNSLPHFTRG